MRLDAVIEGDSGTDVHEESLRSLPPKSLADLNSSSTPNVGHGAVKAGDPNLWDPLLPLLHV